MSDQAFIASATRRLRARGQLTRFGVNRLRLPNYFVWDFGDWGPVHYYDCDTPEGHTSPKRWEVTPYDREVPWWTVTLVQSTDKGWVYELMGWGTTSFEGNAPAGCARRGHRAHCPALP